MTSEPGQDTGERATPAVGPPADGKPFGSWFTSHLGCQSVAFFAVLALDPAGFDVCEGQPSATARAAQWAIAAAATAIGVALLARWAPTAPDWRRRRLAVGGVILGLTGLGWFWLLGPLGGGTCAP